jgi:uncharacterized protein YbjT (DUF2867 family)
MKQQAGPILVTGATGNTGRAIVDALAERGAPVRAMVRTEADRSKLRAGVEVVVADFDEPAAVAAALEGAERAYLVTPSSGQAEEQQKRFADLAAKAGTRHLVVLSQLGSDEHSPVRFLRYHAAVEQHVRNLGIGYTFLRPNLYLQGLLMFAGSISTEGTFFAPIGDARVSAVDVRDIAEVAAVALTKAGHEGATYTLTGPEAITHSQIAAALTAALGRTVRFIDVPPEAFADNIRGLLPSWQVDGLLEDYAHYRRGEAAEGSPAIAQITGTAPRSVEQFARDYAAVFAGQSSQELPVCEQLGEEGARRRRRAPGGGRRHQDPPVQRRTVDRYPRHGS